MFTPEQRARSMCFYPGAVLIDGSDLAWMTGRNVGASVELRRVNSNALELVDVARLQRTNQFMVPFDQRHADIKY